MPFDRPREKMLEKSPKALSNLELVAAMLGNGIKGRDVFEISADVLKVAEKKLDNLKSLEKLVAIDGVGIAKACQFAAALELFSRLIEKNGVKITNHNDVYQITAELAEKKQEYFITLTLDGNNCLIEKRTVFIGTLEQTLVHPREVFIDAINDRASGIILIHNHPSGNFKPSREDHILTERLVKAGKIIGIEVLDHVIISRQGFYSFKQQGTFPNSV